MYYNIHDILGIESNIKILPEFFEGKPKNVDIVIRQGDFEFDTSKYGKLGLKFFGGNDRLYLEYPFYGKPIQKLLIKDLLGKKTEFLFTKFTHSMFGVDAIIDFIIQAKLLEKGYTFIHSGGLTKGNKAFIIAAWSEMGKSSTIFGLARQNFGVLGDDTVILGKNGKVYSFPEKAGIYFHSKNVHNVRLSPFNKMKLFFKYMISKMPPLYLYIDPNLRVDLSKLLPIEKGGKLEKVYFLEWGEGRGKIDKESAINKTISSTIHSLFSNFFAKETFLAYSYLNGLDTQFVEKGMEDVLSSALNKCEILRSTKKDFYKYLLEDYGDK
ncbi:MAG: hypothetical protein HYT70_00800 [Candidatus Aenigmarchaeota archaeon]|nr:hypothetical protein [Candidatus Aenigmarchaeota archaeon]